MSNIPPPDSVLNTHPSVVRGGTLQAQGSVFKQVPIPGAFSRLPSWPHAHHPPTPPQTCRWAARGMDLHERSTQLPDRFRLPGDSASTVPAPARIFTLPGSLVRQRRAAASPAPPWLLGPAVALGTGELDSNRALSLRGDLPPNTLDLPRDPPDASPNSLEAARGTNPRSFLGARSTSQASPPTRPRAPSSVPRPHAAHGRCLRIDAGMWNAPPCIPSPACWSHLATMWPAAAPETQPCFSLSPSVRCPRRCRPFRFPSQFPCPCFFLWASPSGLRQP